MFDQYPIFHEIKSGDTLYNLAKLYNTTVQDILNTNPHINPYNLLIGQFLNIFPGYIEPVPYSGLENISQEVFPTMFQPNNMSQNMQNAVTSNNMPQNVQPTAGSNNIQPTMISNNMSQAVPPTIIETTQSHNCISKNEFNLNQKIRMAWSQHVYWTRLLIVSIVGNLRDTDSATKRVLQTAKDISDLFAPYYGPEVANTLNKLLTEHLVIGKNLIVASKNKDANIDKLNKQWYANADKIAETLNKINPSYYDKEDVRRMFYKHLDLTKEELSNRLNQNYTEDVNSFNKVEAEAMMMADYFVDGIVKQFPDKFK